MATLTPSTPRPVTPGALRVVGVLIVGLLLGATLGGLWSATRTPSYAATAVLRVGLPSVGHDDDLDALRGRPALAQSFALVAVTPDAVDRVTRDLGIGDRAAEALTGANARSEPGSTEISITARDRDPGVAAALANALAQDLIGRAGIPGSDTLEAIGTARPPAEAQTPVVPLGVAIGAVVGLALAAVAVGLWSDTRRRAASAPDAARPVAADRPADSTSDLALGAILGLAVLAVMALQLPSYLALAVSGLAVLTAAVLPPAGLAALIVLLPHQEPEILGAIGIKLPILAALGYGVGIRALAARDVPRPGNGVVAAIGLLGIAFVSAIPAINGLAGERAVAAASRLLPFAAGILLLVIAGWYFRRRDPAPFMVLTLLSVTLASALALLQLVAGDEPIPLIRGLYVEGAAQGLARVTGPFLNPNYFGLFGGLGVVLALGIAVELPQHRRLALLCLPILGLAVLGTLSRGAIAATGVGVLTWLWFRNRQLALLAGAAAVVAGLVVTPLLVGARLDSPTAAAAAEAQAGISSSDQERLESVAAGTQLFLLDPLFGVGFGQYEFVSPRFVGNSFATAAHNQYLKILAEQGIVGMTLYLAGAAALLVAMRRSGSRWRQTAIAMLAVYAVSGLFLEPLTTFQTSGVLWLVLGAVVAGPEVHPQAIGVTARAAAMRLAQAAPRRQAAV